MTYEVKSPILGFEEITRVKFEKIDDFFARITDENNPNIAFTLVNPYALREYSFDVPLATQTLLDIGQQSKVYVYTLVGIQEPIERSVVNFLAPFIFHDDNKTCVQLTLSAKNYPQFGLAEEIGQFTASEV